MSFAIALASFYEDLAERLLAGARAAFAEAGHDHVAVFPVPGAFELPLAASYAARCGRFAGVACLGAVIRGETRVARRGLAWPLVLTDAAGKEQALARAGGHKRDQGRHAAEAVLRMAQLRSELAAG